MADEAVAIETPPTEPASVEATPPDLTVLLQQAREAQARAEGEAVALRAQLAAKPVEVPILTPESVQAAFERGEITDIQRIQALADLQVRARLQYDRQAQTIADGQARAMQTLAVYLAQYPDLTNPASALRRRVSEELGEMGASEGADVNDPRAQVRAIKSVVGAPRKDAKDFQRERIPVGGSSFTGGAAAVPVPPADKLAHVSPTQLAHWRRLGYSPAEMEAEAAFVRPKAG